MTTKKNKWHVVKPADRQRITCGHDLCGDGCANPAYACEHNEWNTGNTTGISFYYYCETHAIANGYKGAEVAA